MYAQAAGKPCVHGGPGRPQAGCQGASLSRLSQSAASQLISKAESSAVQSRSRPLGRPGESIQVHQRLVSTATGSLPRYRPEKRAGLSTIRAWAQTGHEPGQSDRPENASNGQYARSPAEPERSRLVAQWRFRAGSACGRNPPSTFCAWLRDEAGSYGCAVQIIYDQLYHRVTAAIDIPVLSGGVTRSISVDR